MAQARRRMTPEEIATASQQARQRMSVASRVAQAVPPEQPNTAPSVPGQAVVDLGARQNTAGNARQGQTFRNYAAGGKEYHVYAGPNGERQVVAVKARPSETLRNLVVAQGQQQAAGPGDNSGQTQPRVQPQAVDPLAALVRASAAQGGTQIAQNMPQGNNILSLVQQMLRKRTGG